MRLVLDTNTVVSGLLWDSTPSQLIAAGLQGLVELFTSQALGLLAKSVMPAVIDRTAADPDDDHVLACALAAGADAVVTGDAGLLNLKTFLGIPLISAGEAFARLALDGRSEG